MGSNLECRKQNLLNRREKENKRKKTVVCPDKSSIAWAVQFRFGVKVATSLVDSTQFRR